MASGEPIDDRRCKARRERIDTSDSHFTDGRVGKKLDLVDALTQLVECRKSVLENRAAIERGLDALAAAMQQAHAQGMYHAGNGLRHERMGNRQLFGSLRYAAERHCREQDMHVAQLESSADAVLPMHSVTVWLRCLRKMELYR